MKINRKVMPRWMWIMAHIVLHIPGEIACFVGLVMRSERGYAIYKWGLWASEFEDDIV